MKNSPAADEFVARMVTRRAIGLEKHAPAYLTGPSLLLPLALEAIDAYNYACMELERLTLQHPNAIRQHASVAALRSCCLGYARVAARHLAARGGEVLDVEKVAVERLSGPAASEYHATEYLYRPSNLDELVDELVDAFILAGFERERLGQQAPAELYRDKRDVLTFDVKPDEDLVLLARLARALGEATLELEPELLAACPVPARQSAAA